ncbi:hypothetical protein [Nonomuraea sp. NPDC005692]|uniref:hypothetical protein n=1 Tax=Nonomuraea sp. NPDC005692 TaxID=3157168 RepID=UPI0033DB4F90
MKSRLAFAALTAAAVTVSPLAAAAPALAAGGEVVVYTTALQPLFVYANPNGCHNLPPDPHQIYNRTNGDVRLYAFPGCIGPVAWILKPDYGVDTPPIGSFSA